MSDGHGTIRSGQVRGLSTLEALPQTDPSARGWPSRPDVFRELLTPVEAGQYLRLDELTNHTPETAIRTLNYWRDKGQLRATKFARRVWYRKTELDRFLEVKTESAAAR